MIYYSLCPDSYVAPARGRGLKYFESLPISVSTGRPRKGAWIEMTTAVADGGVLNCRPRKGAWIEISHRQRWREAYLSPPQGGVD